MDINAFYNIQVNPVGLVGAAAENYDRDVSEYLLRIARTMSGQILLNCLRNPAFPVEIRPYPWHVCNAGGGSERKNPSAPVTGFVAFSPFEFSPHGACGPLEADKKVGQLPDEILFHELIHVFRVSTGHWSQATISWSLRQYGSNEEFIAVLCTNIYISEKNKKIKPMLRAGWTSWEAMSDADRARFAIFAGSKSAYEFIDQFCQDNPIFTRALSDKLADVEYNPIADFYRFPSLCKKAAEKGVTKDMSLLEKTDPFTGARIPSAFAD
jgi:hypothetical protein